MVAKQNDFVRWFHIICFHRIPFYMSILFLFCLDVNKFAISLHLNFTVTEKNIFLLFVLNVVDCFFECGVCLVNKNINVLIYKLLCLDIRQYYNLRMEELSIQPTS